MNELIPLLVWGFLIYIFTSGSRKKRKDQEARRVLIEERRRRMAEAGRGEESWEASPDGAQTTTLDEPADVSSYGASPETPSTGAPSPTTRQPREPQVPKDVWELIEVLARGGRPAEREPPGPPEPPIAPEPVSLPAPAEPEPVSVRSVRASRSIKQRAEARAAGGLSAVDRVEHEEAADAGLTEADEAEHSKVAAAVARARARRNAGRRRPSRGILGMTGRSGLRKAVKISEVLGRPAALRHLGSYEPPE